MDILAATTTLFRTEVTVYGFPKSLTVRGSDFVYEEIDGETVLVSGTVSRITFTETYAPDYGFDPVTASYTITDLPISAVADFDAFLSTWTEPESFNLLQLSLSSETLILEDNNSRIDFVYDGITLQDLAGAGYDVNNKIIGSSEADNLYLSSGDNEVFAGGGDDSIWGQTGNDKFYGQNGNDYIQHTGSAELYGGRGNDTVRIYNAEGDVAVVYGGSGDDEIFSGFGDNKLLGGAGRDLIVSASGTNVIKGHNGNDTLIGGTGNDTIHGGAHHDTMIDEAGNDRMFGGRGNDVILSVEGDDKIKGGSGDDFLIAAGGNDRVAGNGGADTFAFVDAVITTTETDPYAYFDGPITGSANVVDFNTAADSIAIQYLEDTTAAEQFELFLAQAQQVGSHAVWTSSDGGYEATFRNLDLDDLTEGNFVAVESDLAQII